MRKFLLTAIAAIILATSNPGGASAGAILTATGITSNTMGNYGSGYPSISTLLTETGLSSSYVSGNTDFDSFVNSGVVHQGGDRSSWLSSSGVLHGSVVFDLGKAYDLSKFVIWDGASGISASIASLSVYTSNNADMTGATFVGNFIGQDANFGANVYNLVYTNAQYVELNINGNFGNSCCTVIGAIAFDVPEPATLTLLGAGLLALGAARRRNARSI